VRDEALRRGAFRGRDPQRAAAAAMSISRAATPAWREYFWDSRTERLPPVSIGPNTRFRRKFSSGAAYSARTFAQSHASSSATSIGKAMSMPWLISKRATRMMTVLSGCTITQAFTS
jgi:hypothetical protein